MPKQPTYFFVDKDTWNDQDLVIRSLLASLIMTNIGCRVHIDFQEPVSIMLQLPVNQLWWYSP